MSTWFLTTVVVVVAFLQSVHKKSIFTVRLSAPTLDCKMIRQLISTSRNSRNSEMVCLSPVSEILHPSVWKEGSLWTDLRSWTSLQTVFTVEWLQSVELLFLVNFIETRLTLTYKDPPGKRQDVQRIWTFDENKTRHLLIKSEEWF